MQFGNVSAESESDAFVFFGASGDLAYKQIFPALQSLIKLGQLKVPIIGVAKSSWDLEQLKARAKDSLEKHGGLNADAFAKLCSLLRYVDGDYADASTFETLRDLIGEAKRPLYYLAIPPNLFGTVAQKLKAAGCVANARVVVEKPFGNDLDSAKKLNDDLHEYFEESNIFRIDHFLGKETVQNLIYFRFANPVVEACWNNRHIESVQITMAESFGVSDRGKLYDEVGTIRDVIQNHLLQVVACLAMEVPDDNDHESRRKRRTQLLECVRTLTAADVVRGQFNGYTKVKGVAADSKTETFAALKVFIDNERWQGVPFFIRAGKCLPVTVTEVMVRFKPPTHAVLDETSLPEDNYYRLRLSPEEVIALCLKVKKPGEPMVGFLTELIAHEKPENQMPPYVRLLGDAMRGDPTLFTDEDAVESAWKVVDPILGDATPLYMYEPGTWGPQEVRGKIEPEQGWNDPVESS